MLMMINCTNAKPKGKEARRNPGLIFYTQIINGIESFAAVTYEDSNFSII
jgi:hypothetical protein